MAAYLASDTHCAQLNYSNHRHKEHHLKLISAAAFSSKGSLYCFTVYVLDTRKKLSSCDANISQIVCSPLNEPDCSPCMLCTDVCLSFHVIRVYRVVVFFVVFFFPFCLSVSLLIFGMCLYDSESLCLCSLSLFFSLFLFCSLFQTLSNKSIFQNLLNEVYFSHSFFYFSRLVSAHQSACFVTFVFAFSFP